APGGALHARAVALTGTDASARVGCCQTGPMGVADSAELSAAWEAAWNSHDLDAVLAHFADKVVFYSPYAAQVLPETGGVLRGKDELRRDWDEGLRLVPDLRFTVEGVNAGVSSLVLHYRNQRD